MLTDYTINSVSKRLHQKLQEYIESQYPISNESLLLERRRLLETNGIISKEPFIEATPVYEPGNKYTAINIPNHCKEAMITFSEMSPSVGVFPKPYVHQQEALEAFFQEQKDLVISTGTGSGKTESFLHPILNSLLDEGHKRPEQYKKNAVRALILYPMNALVSDQITRLRKLFGDKRIANYFNEKCGRHPLFGMYTSRTPYPGEREKLKDKYQLEEIIKYYHNIEQNEPKLAKEMKERGKWIAKDLSQFKAGKRGDPKSKYTTSEGDRELFTRHEMQKTPPDILVTNYSMLEYMLMRPIERSIWEQTREWLAEDKNNTFLLVLDEAHMYRGTSGAEVALLIRRLQARLGISRDRFRCILTSASLGDENDDRAAIDFAQQLTGKPESREFKLIQGTKEKRPLSKKGTVEEAKVFSEINNDLFTKRIHHYEELRQHLNKMLSHLNWPDVPVDSEKFPQFLFSQLDGFGPLEKIIKSISGNAIRFTDIAQEVFPQVEIEIAEKATSNLLMLANAANKNGRVLLPVRVHLFYKGVSGIYACTNPRCDLKYDPAEKSLLGKLYDSSKLKCDCGEEARVYELITHRKCGSSFIKGFVTKDNNFLWAENGSGIIGEELKEIHLLVEKPHHDIFSEEYPPKSVWLDIKTGVLKWEPPINDEGYIKLYAPNNSPKTNNSKKKSNVLSFTKCPCCKRKVNNTITDLKTKGEQPFANLVREQFLLQAPIIKEEGFSNEGRKVLLFSDGRQKAARLARDIPNEVEMDSFRQAILQAAKNLIEEDLEPRLGKALYPAVLEVMNEHQLYFFEDTDRQTIMNHVKIFKENFDEDYDDLIDDGDIEILNRFNKELLRQICHPLNSIYQTTTGFIEPMKKEKKKLKKALKEILVEEEIEVITALFIQELLSKVAIDSSIPPYERARIRGFSDGVWGVEKGYVSRDLKKIIGMFTNSKEYTDKIIDILFNLCYESENRYYLSPKKLKLTPGIDHNWYKCKDCKEINMVTVKGACVNCSSQEIEVLDDKSALLDAEKGFWRSPVKNVIYNSGKISNLTVEEHTAQLSQKDTKVAIATTEEYELRFQDIVIDDLYGVVDVLSCTTTMEVGVDIGSLTAVGLRNVPPQRENYQQRAGRAGRRGSALSTVVTYSQGGPHDFYYFKQPEKIISGATRKPVIYIDNKKIVKRHLNAFFIQTYFHEKESLADNASSVLNSSLGDTYSFFEGEPPFNIDSFEKWLYSLLDKDVSDYPAIFDIIPDEVVDIDNGLSKKQFKLKMVKETFLELLNHLDESYEPIRHMLSDLENEDIKKDPNYKLLDFLFNHGLLPTYAFPRDLSSLYIEGWDKNAREIVEKQKPQLEINRALSEYAPGKQIVVDKKTYRIGGIFVPHPKNPLKPANDLEVESLKAVTYCESCLYIALDEANGDECPVCNYQLRKSPFLRPTGFSPERGREVNEGDNDQEFTYAIPPQLPLPVSGDQIKWNSYEGTTRLSYSNTLNEKLIVMNKGTDGKKGFEICGDCGAIWPYGENKDKKVHDVPYLLKKKYGQKQYQCRGETREVFLGNVFHSDLLLLRLQFGEEVEFEVDRQWVHDGLKTLGEAIVLAATRVLDIDYNELSAGYRLLPQNIGGGADIYLFDTLSGGAGYAHVAGLVLPEIISEAFHILSDCENDCETSCYKCLRHYANQFYHNELNRFLALEILDYIVNEKLKKLTFQEQIEILKPLKRMIEIHDESYQEIKDGVNYFIKKSNGLLIGTKNNIERDDSNSQRQLVSSYEVLHDLPNVYLGRKINKMAVT
jgi:ATP-dependent helicase YprA (DUF1998 family)